MDSVQLPSNAKRIKDYSQGLDAPDASGNAEKHSSKANSYLANFLTSSLLNSVSFTQPPPDTTTHKHPLNLQTTSVNFRNFVQNTGPLFSILDGVEGVLLWKSTPVTVLAVLVWTLLCLFPQLVLILPQITLLCILLRNHSIRFANSSKSAAEYTTDTTDTTEKNTSQPPTPTSPSQPPPEPRLPDSSSPDYYLNLQSIQNLMGTTNDGIDAIMPLYRKLNWSDIEQSRGILKYTVVSLLATTIILPLLPVRLIVALAGYSILALNHPLVKEYL